MDFSQGFMIDLAVNAGGYLLAGALVVVVYSLFSRRKDAPAVRVAPVEEDSCHARQRKTSVEVRRMEFVKLGEPGEEVTEKEETVDAETVEQTAERRNRSEIMKIARSMLKAGASHDRIRTVLPVSEAELSLLEMSRS